MSEFGVERICKYDLDTPAMPSGSREDLTLIGCTSPLGSADLEGSLTHCMGHSAAVG